VRILHVQKVKGIGGSERHLLSLLPALAAAGDEVRMMVLAPAEDEDRFIDAMRAAGVEIFSTPAGGDADPRAARAIAREIRAFRPDLVHTHLVHADLWGQLAARQKGVRAVRTFHDVQGFFRREPARAAGRLAGRLARRTIAISEHVAGFVRELGLAPNSRVRVVPYGIDLTEAVPDAAARAAARTRFGMPRDAISVGMASRLIHGKGHDLTIEAVRRSTAALDLAIAGDGPLRAELERRSDGATRFLGQVDDVGSFLSACDLVVFPTVPALGEGFGLAALEAMAVGRPVIATRVGALPEVVEDGVTGLVVAPDPEDLALAIGKLAADEDLRASMGLAGRDRAERLFGLDRMVAGTRQVYREALS